MDRNAEDSIEPTDKRFQLIYKEEGKKGGKSGVLGGSNSRPPAPKAGILPLDQTPMMILSKF